LGTSGLGDKNGTVRAMGKGQMPQTTETTMTTTMNTETKTIDERVQRLVSIRAGLAQKRREDEEEFARYKAAATTETELARVKGYEAHVASVEEKSREFGVDWNPHLFGSFQWKPCVLCRKEIRDDPYGHNPAPLAKTGVCCSKCNDRVCDERMMAFFRRR